MADESPVRFYVTHSDISYQKDLCSSLTNALERIKQQGMPEDGTLLILEITRAYKVESIEVVANPMPLSEL